MGESTRPRPRPDSLAKSLLRATLAKVYKKVARIQADTYEHSTLKRQISNAVYRQLLLNASR